MIRSNFAITRLITLPYGVLLGLYLLVVGGGGAWLYLKVRAAETHMLFDKVTEAVRPLAEKLSKNNALSSAEQSRPWLIADVEALFAAIPSLHLIAIRGAEAGFQIDKHVGRPIVFRIASPLPADAKREKTYAPPEQRFYAESSSFFLIRYDLTAETVPLVRLDFGFDRSMLSERINEGLAKIRQAVVIFALVGGVSIVLACGITVVAIRSTRKAEAYFQ